MVADCSDVFLDTDEFAVAATYTPASGPAQSIKVLFNDIYNEVDPLTGIAYEGRKITAQGLTSVLGSASRDETMTIDGETLYILTVHPDMDGMTMVELSESAQHG